jgi:hypothetical protein
VLKIQDVVLSIIKVPIVPILISTLLTVLSTSALKTIELPRLISPSGLA